MLFGGGGGGGVWPSSFLGKISVHDFRQVSMHLRDPPWCTPALWLFWHWWYMYSVNMILKPILIQAIVVNEYIRVWISSPENSRPVYKTYMFVLGEGGGGVQKKWRVFVFSQISVITDGPLVFVDSSGWHWLFSCSTRFTDFEAIPLRELKLFRAQWKLIFFLQVGWLSGEVRVLRAVILQLNERTMCWWTLFSSFPSAQLCVHPSTVVRSPHSALDLILPCQQVFFASFLQRNLSSTLFV